MNLDDELRRVRVLALLAAGLALVAGGLVGYAVRSFVGC